MKNQAMREIGEELKTAREQKGLSLVELAARLKIRAKYLGALENGEAEDLPPAYVKGYLGNYVRELGLDTASIMGRYQDAFTAEDNSKLSLPQPPQEGMRPTPFILAASLAVAIGVYSYHYYTEKQQVAGTEAPGTPITVSEEAGEPAPQKPVNDTADAKPIAETDLQPLQASLEPGANLVLLAKKSTWVQVLTEKREFLLEKQLRPGDSYKLPENRPLVIRAGDSEAVEVFVDGQRDVFLGTLSTIEKQKTGKHPLADVSPASGE